MNREEILEQWDFHRQKIAEDNWCGGASAPRDWVESILDLCEEAEQRAEKAEAEAEQLKAAITNFAQERLERDQRISEMRIANGKLEAGVERLKKIVDCQKCMHYENVDQCRYCIHNDNYIDRYEVILDRDGE